MVLAPQDVSVWPQDGALSVRWTNPGCDIHIERSDDGGELSPLVDLPATNINSCGFDHEHYLDATATSSEVEYCYQVGCGGWWSDVVAPPVCASP